MKKISIIDEDFERLRKLSKEDKGLILENLLHTAFGEEIEITGNEYLDFLSEVVCQKAERFAELSEKRSKVGALAKGVSKSKAKAKQNESKTKQTQSKSEAHTIPNHTIPNHINKKSNKFCDGIIAQTYDFQELEKKVVKN